MRTYRDLFAVGEFRALFVGQLATAASLTIQTLGVSTLVYVRTASPLLATVTFLAGSLPQAVGAMTLAGISDRMPPRQALIASDCVRASACILLASGALPIAGMIAVLAVVGVASGALGGIRFALVTQIIPLDAYVLGRSALNAATGGMQVLGYAVGGVLVTTIGAGRALWIAAACATFVCLADRCGLRPHTARNKQRSSVTDTWRTSLVLLRDGLIGRVLLAQWLPNGLIVGAEALFVPYAGRQAAVLFTAAAAGMVVGDFVSGRWLPVTRRPVGLALYLLLAAPYLSFAAHPRIWVAAPLVAAGSFGYGGTLGFQQRLVEVVPQALLGHALALASAGMLTAQGLAAYAAGALADAAGTASAMTAMGGASIVATIALLGLAGLGRGNGRSVSTTGAAPEARWTTNPARAEQPGEIS